MTKEIYRIPDIKEISNDKRIWKPGSMIAGSMTTGEYRKKRWLSQSTIPLDDLILEKLGFTKGDLIISLASNHADWAKLIKDKGCIVDYSEMSKPFINYVKKRIKFRKYLNKDFSTFPNKINQYAWSFSYEPVSGERGLPIAIMRSLLNQKGGVLVYYNDSQPVKAKNWPRMFKTIAETYGAKYSIKSEKIDSFRHIKGNLERYKKSDKEFKIFTIKTNKNAKNKVLKDLGVMNQLRNKNKTKNNIESLKRLDKLNNLFLDRFLKDINIK
tara:strand:- start:507 stop:1316 length:810 start_codon:yes stop_codon:yes gene_type:complete